MSISYKLYIIIIQPVFSFIKIYSINVLVIIDKICYKFIIIRWYAWIWRISDNKVNKIYLEIAVLIDYFYNKQWLVLRMLDIMEETSEAISSDVSFRPSSSHLFMIPAQPFTIKALYISVFASLKEISAYFHRLQRCLLTSDFILLKNFMSLFSLKNTLHISWLSAKNENIFSKSRYILVLLFSSKSSISSNSLKNSSCVL